MISWLFKLLIIRVVWQGMKTMCSRPAAELGSKAKAVSWGGPIWQLHTKQHRGGGDDAIIQHILCFSEYTHFSQRTWLRNFWKSNEMDARKMLDSLTHKLANGPLWCGGCWCNQHIWQQCIGCQQRGCSPEACWMHLTLVTNLRVRTDCFKKVSAVAQQLPTQSFGCGLHC